MEKVRYKCLLFLVLITGLKIHVSRAEDQNITPLEYLLTILEESDSKATLGGTSDVILTFGRQYGTHHDVVSSILGPEYVVIGDEEQSFCNFILPEITIDYKNDRSLVYLPQLPDQFDFDCEIARVYYLRKIFENAKRMKIVLFIEHGNLDETQFESLSAYLTHVINLFPNVHFCRESAGLVVTDCFSPGENRGEDNVSIKRLIHSRKNEFENELYFKINDNTNITSELEKKIEILGYFSNSNSQNTVCDDSFVEVSLKFEPQSEIQILVFNETFYSNLDIIQEMKFEMSDYAIGFIKNQFLNDLNSNLRFMLQTLFNDIKNTLHKIGKQSLRNENFDVQINNLRHQYLNFQSNMMKNKSAFVDFVSFGINFTETAYYSESRFKTFIDYIDYLYFFAEYANDDSSLINYQNMANSELKNLDYLLNWCNLVMELKTSLSSYRIQLNVSFDSYFKDNVTLKSQNNVKIFLDKVENHNLANKNLTTYIRDNLQWPVNENFVFEINEILVINLRTSMTFTNNVYVFEARGNFILISKIIHEMKGCKKEIFLFSTHTIFIDNDLECSSSNLIIISPNIEVIGIKKLSLSASQLSYSEMNPNKAPSGYIDWNNKFQATNGASGSPGIPGKNAGNLLLITDKIKSQSYLSIYANGGTGGKGQDGGDGYPGNIDAPYKDTHGDYTANIHDIANRKGATIEYQGKWRDIDRVFVVSRYDIFLPSHGGNGGISGKGGFQGNLDIICNTCNNNIIKQNLNGSNGVNGNGGSGYSKYRKAVLSQLCEHYKRRKFRCDWNFGSYRTDPFTTNNGRAGGNSNNQQSPILMTKIDKNTIILKYKSYYRQNLLKNNLFEIQNEKFLDLLHTDKSILEKCDLICMSKDFLDIENNYNKITDQNAEPNKQYELLLRSLELSVSYKFISNSTPEYLLYNNALVGKLAYATHNTIIVDLEIYIDTSLAIIESIEKSAKNVISFEKKETYVNDLQLLIDEANNYVSNSISTELNSITASFENAFAEVLKEIENLKNELKEKRNELVEEKKRLEKAVKKAAIFGVLNSIASVISIFAPVTGTVLKIGLGVAGKSRNNTINFKFRMDDEFTIEKSMEHIENIYNPRVDSINNLKKTLDEILNMNLEINGITEQVNIAKNKLTELTSLNNMFYKKDIKSEAISIIFELKSFIFINKDSKLKKITDLQAESAGNFLESAGNVFGAASEIGNAVAEYNNGKKEIAEIDEAIRKIDKEIADLTKLQEEIYESMGSMLSNMHSDLSNFIESSQNQNSVALEIKKWEAKSKILELKEKLRKLTKTLESGDEFNQGIEKIENLITLVLNLLDRAQEYQQQQKLATFIYDINTASFEANLLKHNPQFKYYLDQLKFSLQSNILFEEYFKIKSAFEQQIFPFGSKELDILKLPSTSDKLAVISAVKNSIIAIKNKLIKMASSINTELDTSIILTAFNPNYQSSRPFYVWNEKDYKTDFKNFRKGSKITVISDVFAGYHDNAIKFNLIEVNITSVNVTKQKQLENILKSFTIDMTHFGYSYYKCDGNYYVMNGIPFTIIHGFERYPNGDPVLSNLVYDKIKNNKIFMSPFTIWGFKLNNRDKNEFKKLENFNDDIKIELIGKGQYLDENNKVCLQSLNKFYDFYSKVDPMNKIQ